MDRPDFGFAVVNKTCLVTCIDKRIVIRKYTTWVQIQSRRGLITFIYAKYVKMRTYLYKAPALCSDDQYDHLSIAISSPIYQTQSLIHWQLSGPLANSRVRDNRPGVGVWMFPLLSSKVPESSQVSLSYLQRINQNLRSLKNHNVTVFTWSLNSLIKSLLMAELSSSERPKLNEDTAIAKPRTEKIHKYLKGMLL